MSAPILEARGLTKRYGDRAVVDRLDLVCRRGTVLGLLGANGAGKTTTLRMLYGFVPPDAGAIFYGGQSFAEGRAAAKRSIGVCTQEDSLDYDFTVAQNLRIYASYFRPRVAEPRRPSLRSCSSASSSPRTPMLHPTSSRAASCGGF